MRIRGLQKLSVVDFPGQVCAIIFLQGCNFFCPYCQNPDLVKTDPDSFLSTEEVFEYLGKRRNFIDGVVVSGGEPVLQAALAGFIRDIKDAGFKVKLDTNGSRPEVLRSLIEDKLIDYVALDIKTSPEKYHLVSSGADIPDKIISSVKLLLSSGVPYEFRTTCVPGIVDQDDIVKIGEVVKGAEKHYLQQFRTQVTLEKSFQSGKIYGKDSLEAFRKILSGYVKEVGVRGV